MLKDTPYIKCLIRKEFLRNLEDSRGKFVEAYIFAVTALMNRPLLFTAHTVDGAVVSRLPISAFCKNKKAPMQSLNHLELWGCIGPEIDVMAHAYLKNYRVMTYLPDGKVYPGTYLFTIDPSGGALSEEPDQHKTWNIIELDNGNFTAQPNNRCLFVDSHFVRCKGKPNYKTNTHSWFCEDLEWSAGNTDKTFY